MQSLSHFLTEMPSSATIAVSNRAAQLRAEGHDVIALAGGDPDFDTPPHIVRAAVDAIAAGDTHYPTPTRGTRQAVEAIARKFERDSGVAVDAPNQIIITPGGKWALYLGLAAILNPGDEVLILDPSWVSYRPLVRMLGGVPVHVTLDAADNFQIEYELLSAAVSKRTKAIIVNTPCNPTGRVLTAAEIDAITQLALAHDLYVVSDELYEKLIFDGEHRSPAAKPGMQQRTLTINGLSKAYAMTGWRLGWLIAPAEIIRLAARLHSQTVTAASSFGMQAIVAALDGPQQQVAQMCDSYRQRRDMMVERLNAIPGIDCPSPQGTFYLFLHFSDSALRSEAIAARLLDDLLIAATPGVAFGQAGDQHIRFSIATSQSELVRACERLAARQPWR